MEWWWSGGGGVVVEWSGGDLPVAHCHATRTFNESAVHTKLLDTSVTEITHKYFPFAHCNIIGGVLYLWWRGIHIC